MSKQAAVESTHSSFQLNIAWRLGFLGALLFAEKFLLSSLVDAGRARVAQGIGAFVHDAQHWGFRCLVTFLASVSVLAFVRAQHNKEPHDKDRRLPEVRPRWILCHALLVATLVPLSYWLYRGDVTSFGFAAMAGIWVVVFAAAAIALGIGLMPSVFWLNGFRSLGIGWIYAAAVALLGTSAWIGSERLWASTTALTFDLVRGTLTPVLANFSTNSTTRVISTANFAVEISEVCSGLEGLGLMLAFSTIWLFYFRREYIFPRALFLIPLSLVAIFGLNVLRIAALFLIGNAGFAEVALYGFHSQAGWIAFNAVACALVYFSRRSRWLTRAGSAPADALGVHNPTAIYLMPLLAMLAAGVLSHAMSGQFEMLYPLRFIVSVAVLAAYRRHLCEMDWAFSWRGLIAGSLVFIIWVGAARVLLPPLDIPAALNSLSPAGRWIWISSRLLASILTVPIAEELAYRGYLMRRLGHANFDSVSFSAVRWPAVAVSSIAFGLGHGALWLPGIGAGCIYGLLVTRTGRLGEALAAHVTTNALLAMLVLLSNQWQFW